MKLFTGWVLAAGLALARDGGQCADARAQQRFRISAAPYSEGPIAAGRITRRRRWKRLPAASIWLRIRAGRAGSAARGLQHHPQAGFSPLGIPRQRGFVYTIAVIDRGGEDGRLVIDARSGRIIRFVPAWQNGAPYEGAWNSSYGPPGPLPPTAVRGEPRPPASVPRVASRSVPMPKPSPLNANAATAPAKPAAPTRRQAAGRAVVAASRGHADEAGRRRAG